MAEKNRPDLKSSFGAGDKLREQSFIDLIDSLVSTKEDSTISGSILPAGKNEFDLGSAAFPWKAIHASGSVIFTNAAGETTTLSQTDLDELKSIESLRKSDSGIPIKRLRAFNSATSFIDFNTTANGVAAGSAIDFIINSSLQALNLSENSISLGPSNNFPIEVTGALNVTANSSTPHQLGGVVSVTGETQGSGTSGLEVSGSLIQSSSGGIVSFNEEGSSFTNGNVLIEDAIISQPGVIGQSINIGTNTSPSIAEYMGVGDNHRIKIAAGVTVNVSQGSRLIIKNQQPNLAADASTGDITVSAVGGADIAFNIGEFGTNPQYIPQHRSIPAGNVANWYGPIFIGRYLSPGGNILNLDIAGQGQNSSLRLNEGAQVRINTF
jgi:hypothetical protein